MLYRLNFDPSRSDLQVIGTPVDADGDEWAFWRLLQGTPVAPHDLRPWRVDIVQNGISVPLSFAGFDVPIVDAATARLLAQIAPSDIQLPSVLVGDESEPRNLLVVTKSLRCVDEQRSVFTRWGPDDGRADKVGQYRMFVNLALDPEQVPEGIELFRVEGWQVALVATDRIVRELQKHVKVGLVYKLLV